LAALDKAKQFPVPALSLAPLESTTVVAVRRFVDKLLEERAGDVLRDGICALFEA